MEKNNKVLVGMSGGVDSSVTVGLLLDAGYDVSGITITPFKVDERCKISEGTRSCCNAQSIADAMEIAERFGISHHLVDMTSIFEDTVVKNFVSEYLNARTPNPCILCNPEIKWRAMLAKADELGCYYVATGHYASVKYFENIDKYLILKGLDKKKDQSYFLWRLTQDMLRRTLFPLGIYEKTETRRLAAKYGLTVKDKPDSQEICFVPENDYRSFLSRYVKNGLPGEGDFILHGKPFGRHTGFENYTVGQRKGLGLSYSEPLFVTSIDATTNRVYLDTFDKIGCRDLNASDIIMMKYDDLNDEKEFTVKVRYRDPGTPALCRIEDGILKVHLLQPKNSIAPGQSLVLYEDDELVGGGVICRNNNY